MSVLDASAILAFLFKEEGAERVRPLLATSIVSAVNWAEVLGRFTRDGHDGRQVEQRLLQLGLTCAPYTAVHALATAALVPWTRPFGLSLGDRACLALAILEQRSAVTSDRAWLGLNGHPSALMPNVVSIR
ncbi:MAG: type II toxin-antitoxin system VapC family toxin [Myxococcales bacterium]|nr:type II toxin-antitoxin system VapC family toxin [Myxococcales bacterium]